MTKNVGKMDQFFRIIIAISFFFLDYFNVVTGAISWILSILAILLIVTGLISFCPLYTLLGKNTCETK